MKALQELEEIGIQFKFLEDESSRLPGVRPDAIVDIFAGAASGHFFVEERHRAPYLNEIARLRVLKEAFAGQGEPLLCAPFIPETIGSSLTDSGWSWADDQGNFDLRAPGLVLRQRRTSSPPKVTSRQLPQGSGGLAIVRALIHSRAHNEGSRTASIAAQAHVSQPRVSQVLRQLEDHNFVERYGSRDWRVNRSLLLDQFLAEYTGPGGSDHYFYSLDSPTEVATHVAQNRNRDTFAISADVGPDLIVPWRRPNLLIIYGSSEFASSGLGMVEAHGQHDANIIVRLPKDRSVFPDPALISELAGTKMPLADPTQMIWDLQQLGGADRLEAADHLREWLLKSR